MEKEHIIRDAEIEEVVSKEETLGEIINPSTCEVHPKKGRRMDWVLLFILGLLIGVVAKQEAGKRIVIGFDDYLMRFGDQNYSINAMDKELRANPEKRQSRLGSLSAGGNCQQQ